MTASIPEAELRRRVSKGFTPDAIRRERVERVAWVTLWSVLTAIALAAGDLWDLWLPLLLLLMSVANLVIAYRKRPRSASELTDREVTQARQNVRACPRCGEAVLMSESRCPNCGSVRHRFGSLGAYGIDQWMPIAAILLLVGLLLLAAMALR